MEEGGDVNMIEGDDDCRETESQQNGDQEEETYLAEGEDEENELECDESAYIIYHQARTGAPCLSFDIIRDNLGDDRAEQFPLTAYIAAGTQAQRAHVNNVIVMKMSNMNKVQPKEDTDSGSESEDEGGDREDGPVLECALIPHQGCVNRIRVTYINETPIAASWSEKGKVFLWDLSSPLTAVNNRTAMLKYMSDGGAPKSLFSFSGHLTEGYAMDWSPLKPGMLVTGDCNKNIHLWKPLEDGQWHVDQRAFSGHTQSVEDLQWSPNEANVLASCSVDHSIRIWDVRANPAKACILTAENAHENDINVISWNHSEPFIVSGGDDGIIKVWDLRQFQSGQPVVVFKHHTAPITSVEWHPTDSSVFAASGSDNQLTLWDLAVERDLEMSDERENSDLMKLPPQLLFIHQGQKDIKEIHWHPQMPGLIISTAQSGFNIFRTISV